MYLEVKEENLSSYESVRKVHEVNNHKGSDQLVSAYSRAGWMGPEVANVIRRAVKDCRVCQNFAKSVSRPKVTLPIACLFNGIITIDLKSFGSNYVLWMIDSFSLFVQG